MIKAIVYSRPSCMRCHVTHRKIKAMGIPVTMEQIDEHPDKIQRMEAQGWMELPLVEATIDDEVHYWAGMSTADLHALEHLVRAQPFGGDAA